MRVVVTGATGNVGTSVIDALAADNAVTEVVGVARRRPEPGWRPAKTSFVEADVATEDLAPILDGADALVHLAWRFQPTHQPMVTWEANAIGSVKVFDAAARAGVGAVVHASSIGAYSPGPGRTVDESWPTHSIPTAAYGREKAYVERALDAFEAHHPDVRVVRMRPAFIFKWEAASEQRRIFAGPALPRALVLPGRVPVVPLPTGLRFKTLHTDDAAEAYRLAVTTDARGAFNLASDPVIDRGVIAEVLEARVIELPRSVVRAAVAGGWHSRLVPADPALLDLFLGLPLLDTTRARLVLGWEPARSAVDTLREAVEGMAEGAGMATPPLAPDR